MKAPVINLDQLELVPISERLPGSPDAYLGSAIAPISSALGAEKLGYNLTVVPPGKSAFPFHNHFGNEEMFYILEGSGELRYGTDRFPLRAGDIIACPCGGQDRAHQILNLTHPAKLDLGFHVFAKARRSQEGFCQRRFDEGGAKRIHANAMRREFNRHGFRQPLNRPFGRAIDRPIGRADMAHLR